MKHKKYIAIALTALLTFGSAQTALAAVIYHDLGDMKDDVVITKDGEEHIFTNENNITVNYSIIVEEGVVTHIVLNGVNIETTDKNGIKIGSKANVVLEIQGENNIGVFSTVDEELDKAAQAAINITDGTLTIPVEDGTVDLLFTIECNVVNPITTEIGTQEVRVGKTHIVKTDKIEMPTGVILDCVWGEDAAGGAE